MEKSYYVLIAKEFPPSFFGSFNSINRNPLRGWICEEQTGINDLTQWQMHFSMNAQGMILPTPFESFF